MLQKAVMEAIVIEKAAALQPAVVRGNSIHGVEAQAAEDVCGDVRALFGRVDRDRVKGVELRSDQTEHSGPDRAGQYGRTGCLDLIEMQQIPQAAQHVNSQGADTEHAQIRLLVASFEQVLEGANKR